MNDRRGRTTTSSAPTKLGPTTCGCFNQLPNETSIALAATLASLLGLHFQLVLIIAKYQTTTRPVTGLINRGFEQSLGASGVAFLLCGSCAAGTAVGPVSDEDCPRTLQAPFSQ